MFKNVTPIIMKAISPVHAGSGRELGIVDMPIQRESHTGIPKIEGSSIKGAMREWTRIKNTELYINKLFGKDGNESAGLVGFSDAKLLFYPVKTLSGIFAYTTCPYLLDRFMKELEYVVNPKSLEEDLDKINEQIAQLKQEIKQVDALVSGDVLLVRGASEIKDKKIELEEYSFSVKAEVKRDSLFRGIDLQPQRHIVILRDEDFIEIISLCKEIITRNKVDSTTGTVVNSALFTEEYLPAESILYTLLVENGIESTDNTVADYVQIFQEAQIAQVGGNVNIGKGIVEMKAFIERSRNSEES